MRNDEISPASAFMELRYQNTQEDFKVFYSALWREQKAARRSEFYQSIFWYLGVLGLAIFVAAKHQEILLVCVFAVLAAFYLRENWSFERHWNRQAAAYAEMTPESSVVLALDEAGLRETFSGIQLNVPWSELRDYGIDDDRLFIRFLVHRAFIVPLRQLSAEQREHIVKLLEEHNVQRRNEFAH
jgi:hypothetical protein